MKITTDKGVFRPIIITIENEIEAAIVYAAFNAGDTTIIGNAHNLIDENLIKKNTAKCYEIYNEYRAAYLMSVGEEEDY